MMIALIKGSVVLLLMSGIFEKKIPHLGKYV